MLRRSFLSALAAMLLVVLPQSGIAQTRTFVDAAGRSVELPVAIHRAMAAGPPASVLLYAIAPEKMVGWVRAPSAEEKAFLAIPYRDLPAHGRLTDKGNTANIEAVLALKPDVIIDVGTVDGTYASLADRVQQQTGIPYVLIDGRFAKSADSLRKLGDILGEPGRADELVRFADEATRRLDTAVKAIPAGERPHVYYGRGPDGLETGLAGSINTEVLEAVGATNVADAAGAGGLARVSMEQLLAWNPDIILTLDRNFQAKVATDPVWASITAVKNHRVYQAPALPFGWFDAPPGINRIIGVAWLTSALYPGRTDIDLRQETRTFYHLFYHVELTEPQLDSLLATATGKP
ncbi:iron ABC transporter substrate-binding protein [Labrys sp. KB_33_2]|uniref:iron ABC transporter substrate-binding protein n=1 Tax=Labrys sp. KB_33_2 TaxID=3237479 RepID=UPI003F90F239